MKNPKRSITLKVIAGYLVVAALAALAVWFTYSQVVKFSALTQSTDLNSQQLLVGEIATELIETENVGRRFIQTGDSLELKRYSTKIEFVQTSLDSLRNLYKDSPLKTELDSLSILLSKKRENLEELHELRTRDRNTSYYREVIRQLEKVDPSFNPPNYNRRFNNLEPHQRQVIIQLLEFNQPGREERISTVSADSLIRAVRNVLSELERENRLFREVINKKESELLVNDIILNEQLRNLLRVIESEERVISLARVENSDLMLKDISRTIFIVGAASVLIILVFLLFIVKDISRGQRYRLKLEEANAFNEALMQRREQFIATITHDLRSPLNTVIGYTELMGKAGLTKKQDHYLGHLKKSSEYILHLVNDLLDLSKLEAGKMHIENLPFNPKNLLEDTFYNTIPDDDKKGLELITNTSPETDCHVLSDPFRIKQILSNLIANAYKFTEEGKITASLSMTKRIEDRYILKFSIKDSGIGINKSKQEEIFEEFSQEHGQIEKQYGGTGLGLAIAKRLTSLLEGNIELKSEPGLGSEFIVSIPVKKVKGEVLPVQQPEIREIPENLKGKNILIVDDESSQLALTRELIKSTGMRGITAGNGEEALEKLKDFKCNLILTDIQMPKMDGFVLIRELKKDPVLSEIPVIAISGRINVPAEEYISAGFAGNILKPYKPSHLLLKIEEILNIHFDKKENKERIAAIDENEYSLDEIFLFAGEDQIALDTILNAFIHSTRLNIEEIKKSINIDDKERVAQIAHRMLPMFKQLRIKEIVPKLEKLERKEHQSFSSVKIEELVEDIENLLQQLQKEVKA